MSVLTQDSIEVNGKAIARTIIENGHSYEFDRLAHMSKGGSIPLNQLRADELVVAPGAIYRRVATK